MVRTISLLSTEVWCGNVDKDVSDKDRIELIVPILQLLGCMHVCRNKVPLRSWMDEGIDEWMMTSLRTDVHEKSEVLLNLVALLPVCLLFCFTLHTEPP